MQSKDGDDAQRLLDALQPLWHGGSSTARKGGKRKRGGSQPRSSKVRHVRPTICMQQLQHCAGLQCVCIASLFCCQDAEAFTGYVMLFSALALSFPG
jgi:hypothetical protein